MEEAIEPRRHSGYGTTMGSFAPGETYKDHLRLTFADGAAVRDPSGLFNANLQGVTRAIVIHDGDEIDEPAFKSLIRAAAALNASSARG